MFSNHCLFVFFIQDPSNNISQNDGPLPVIPSNPLSVSTVHRIHQLDGANGDSSSEESDDSSESEPEEEQEGVSTGHYTAHTYMYI